MAKKQKEIKAKKKDIRQKLKENKKTKGKKTVDVKIPNQRKDSAIKQKLRKGQNNTSSKKTKKNNKKKTVIKNSFLTPQQESEIKNNKSTYEEMSIAELKSLLKKNNQVMTGTKTDLVNRCAEGKILGALPHCPKCFAGKLRFDIKTGYYKCPGYMDDTEFKNCGFTDYYGSVQRNPWVD